jgi:RNA polymerase sigma-70 factor (ECF subfamily)
MLTEARTEVPELPTDSGMDPLVERCRSGDGAAWRTLYDTHFDFAWRTARRLGLSDADAEDAVQEAFQTAFQHLGAFHTGRFSTWLYRIVANEVSARVRRRRVREFFSGLLGASQRTEVASPEGAVDARRTLAHVERILGKLSREKREAFALHEIEGLSHDEIGELVGARAETVRTRLFYARREFEQHARRLGVEP